MKKVFIPFFITIWLFSSFNSAAQEITKGKGFDPSQFVYWFYIKAEIKLDKEYKRPVYVVRTLSTTLKSGTIAVYEKELWRNLQSGQQLVIGPFLDYNDAKLALAIYDMVKLPKDKREPAIALLKDTVKSADEYYWYLLKFSISPRTHKYILERMPARVAPSGSFGDFLDLFFEGITYQALNIGPFPSQIEAEESKRLNRLEEK